MPGSPQPSAEPRWFKSSYSGGNTTECIEAAVIPFGVLVRDSKQPERAQVTISARAWGDFLAGARRASW
ncbi:DUF397 domain-containing protein [Streptomyces sp. NPDC050625]|uniref:DUF397 domain-containing protein n=1 Tax=Streptomyces sp. NPDC050625 TaxID=3154629 RepID=UPI003420A171